VRVTFKPEYGGEAVLKVPIAEGVLSQWETILEVALPTPVTKFVEFEVGYGAELDRTEEGKPTEISD